MSWQRVRIKIPETYGPLERKAIAQEIIDRIIDRSKKDSLDKNNKPLPEYSESYKKSEKFRQFGKTGKVNLTLSDEMLNSIELISDSKGSLLIGFDKGDNDLNAKAEGNIKGTYGQKKPVDGGKKKRDFLGIHKDDLKDILENYPTKKEERKEKLNVLKFLANNELDLATPLKEAMDLIRKSNE